MNIKGKVHCLFEQSGTFKNAFREIGIPAYDYDIKNEYGQTDFRIDIFREIHLAFSNIDNSQIFKDIKHDDLIIAFFPCIYFSQQNVCFFNGTSNVYNKMTLREKTLSMIRRNNERSYFYETLLKMCEICEENHLRLIVENPYSSMGFLTNNFPHKPAVIDWNRRLRGDYYQKPTQYYFINCKPTHGFTRQHPEEIRTVNNEQGHFGSSCGRERSEIAPAYARAFIQDFLFGEERQPVQTQFKLT